MSIYLTAFCSTEAGILMKQSSPSSFEIEMKAVGQFYVVRKEVEDFPVNNSCTTDSHSDSTDA